ncbi:hypothetical protein VIGAN_04256300, partial [Vigna angularis var. angularis]
FPPTYQSTTIVVDPPAYQSSPSQQRYRSQHINHSQLNIVVQFSQFISTNNHNLIMLYYIIILSDHSYLKFLMYSGTQSLIMLNHDFNKA